MIYSFMPTISIPDLYRTMLEEYPEKEDTIDSVVSSVSDYLYDETYLPYHFRTEEEHDEDNWDLMFLNSYLKRIIPKEYDTVLFFF